MLQNCRTRELLQKIAEITGNEAKYFFARKDRSERTDSSRLPQVVRRAAMLPRLFKAFLALPRTEHCRSALRMMEAMASRVGNVTG